MTIKEVSWWTFYILFLIVLLFLLALILRELFGGALARISNAGLFIYFIGLIMAVFGLMAMCIAYVVRVMWYRLKSNRGGHIQNS